MRLVNRRNREQPLRLLAKVLFVLAHLPATPYLLGWFFTYMSFLLPVPRLHETNTLIAFHHPQPSYPLHILLVPKRPLANLCAITANDTDFLTDLFQTVNSLVEQFQLETAGYRLIANGGSYQEVAHLHFHLISDAAVTERGRTNA